MNAFDWLQMGLVLSAVTLLTAPIGKFMKHVFDGEPHLLDFLKPIERGVYCLIGIDPKEEMNRKIYLKAVLIFNALGIVVVFLFQVLQNVLPLNPQDLPSVPWHLAFNTAISFVTNTNWHGGFKV